MNRDFWKDKKVFLTGHTGFKGSWLSLWLQQLGADVTGFALAPTTFPNLFTEASVANGMHSIIGDIRDVQAVQKAMQAQQPDIIIHMAAQPLVRYSYQYPVETYATNVMGTVHVLEAARSLSSVRAIVNVTTDKCYENKEWLWAYRENEPMGGRDPYSNSKGCAELVTAAYRQSFFEQTQVGLASARAGNVIGGGDWSEDRLIPDIMRACLHDTPLTIRYPHAIRPWQHVLEPLSGYLTLAEALFHHPKTFAQGWNFGPAEDDAKPVSWIADHLLKRWGQGMHWSLAKDAQPHEATYLKLDCAKAKSLLHWQPRWSLDITLDKIVDWYQAFQRQASIRDITLLQMKNYMGE